VCPYAWSFVCAAQEGGAGDAVIVTTMCDQMRRAAEWIERDTDLPLFLMNLPSTWRTATAEKMYIAELERLGRFLVRLGGVAPAPEKLATIMRDYDDKRTALRAAWGRLSPRQFFEAVLMFNREGRLELDDGDWEPRGVPIAMISGPAPPYYGQLLGLIEAAGGMVVLDGTETGERTLPAPFDRRHLRTEPFLELVQGYFGSIPDAFRRPNSMLYEWLKHEIDARGIRGIIFHYFTWCDMWHAEAGRMKQWAGVPLLAISGGMEDQFPGHTASRVESFIETLQ